METDKTATNLTILRYTALALFLAVLSATAIGLGDVGITWDEPDAYFHGSEVMRAWLMEVGQKLAAGEWKTIFDANFLAQYWPVSTNESLDQVSFNDHPTLPRVLPTIAWYLFHLFAEETVAYRLASAILFSASVVVVFRIMAMEFGYAAGLFSAVSLLVMPRVFGDAHIAATDMPLMSFWLFSVAAFHKGLTDRKWSYVFAVLLGLTLEVKITGFMLPLSLGLYMLLARDARAWRNVAVALVISPIIFWILNPTWWNDGVARIYDFIHLYFIHGDVTPIPLYYLGKTYRSDVPWHYSLALTAITIPAAVFCFSLAGIFFSLNGIFRKGLGALFLAQLIFFYFILVLPTSPKYDGVRLFLPVFPVLACLAGIGFERMTNGVYALLEKKYPERLVLTKRHVAGIVFMVSLFPPALHLAAVHPYYLEYYSGLIGGVSGAHKQGFETTYWMSTLTRQVREDINELLPDYIKVATSPPLYPYFHYLQKQGLLKKALIVTPKNPDVLILVPRQGKFDEETWKRYLSEKPIYTASLDGVPLVLIYRLHRKEEN